MKYLISLTILFTFFSCASKKDYFVTNKNENQKEAPYILLISIDGYRWDYTDMYKPTFLTKFKNEGSSVKSLIPSFPTKTFPNHLSIITGRYPMNHGIVGNRFYAPDLERSYSLRDASAVTDSRFYLSKPFWVLAEEQGLKSATYFWPGSEASFEGIFPSYYLKYNHGTSHQKRIDTIVEWFEMDKEVRPHFVTMYFHDVDSAGHRHGPESEQTKNAVEKVDASIKQLLEKLDRMNLPINVIIVSDHGMAALSQKNREIIGKTKKSKEYLSNFKAVGSGPLVHFYRENKDFKFITRTMNAINKEAENFKCYKKNKTPKKLNFRKNVRIGDFVCIANEGWSISTKEKKSPKGNHGWSQYAGTDMHSILYAKGPAFKTKYQSPSFRNIDIYPMMAEILGLKVDHKIDGNISKSKNILK